VIRGWWLAGVCSCNWMYGLDETRLQDAQGIDAPAVCTTNTALQFARQARQAVLQDCRDYTFVGDRAVAHCGYVYTGAIAEGPVDGTLVNVTIAPTEPEATIHRPRLMPDGELLVSQRFVDGHELVSVYERAASGWGWSRDLPFTLGADDRAGVPSRGPARQLFITRRSFLEVAVEGQDNQWTITALPFTAFGVSKVHTAIHLSADGTRAVFAGDGAIHYAVRKSVDVPFSGAYRLELPDVPDPFLAADCSRIYFSGLESIFFVQR
jgi:hypothetical protein